MITFNTQEEFEEAVMLVVKDRLTVNVHCYTEYYPDQTKVEVTLSDNGDEFSMSRDSTT